MICVFINIICVSCVFNAFYVFKNPLWPMCPPAGLFFSAKQASPEFVRRFMFCWNVFMRIYGNILDLSLREAEGRLLWGGSSEN